MERDDVFILEEASASEDSDMTEVCGQQLRKARKTREYWLM